MKNAARVRKSRGGTDVGHASSFAAAVRSRYGRGSRQPGRLCLVLAEPLKIHRHSRHTHWSPSLYVRVDLPVIAKPFGAAKVDIGRSIAGTATVVHRVERTAERLQVTLARAVDLHSRHRLHRPAAQNLPPLRQELVRPRPAPVAAGAESAHPARRSEETWSAPAVQALQPQGRPEFSLDMNRITDQVIRKIDRRIIAARERLGRI